MNTITLYDVGQYGSPFTPDDRDRTIAALFVAQGGSTLGFTVMRRDILRFLMSDSAVNYWLNSKCWLEKCGKVGRVELLRLTAQGINQCGSPTGPSANVRKWMERMTVKSASSGAAKTFAPLT